MPIKNLLCKNYLSSQACAGKSIFVQEDINISPIQHASLMKLNR